ncbi:hypothetical protein IIA79_05595 [bacterium]|nr:hypothetical protein [bacterium]
MRQFFRMMLALFALLGALAIVPGCSGEMGWAVIIGDGPVSSRTRVVFYDGYRDGNYVYYHGRWHYRGIGTPYYWYWDDYDPYYYWW